MNIHADDLKRLTRALATFVGYVMSEYRINGGSPSLLEILSDGDPFHLIGASLDNRRRLMVRGLP